MLLKSLQRQLGERCVLHEARPANGRAYDKREHCWLLLEKLGDPAPDDHFDPEAAAARRRAGCRRPAVGRRAALSDLRIALERALPANGIEAVLIDEGQHMFATTSGHRMLQDMDFLKSMSNVTGVRHVIAGSPDLLSLQELTPQLHRRVRVIRFGAYRKESATDRRHFLAIFKTLLNLLPLPEQQELPEEVEFVFQNSAGCVGTLKDWLRRALAHALRNGLPSVDGDVLRTTEFEPGAVHAFTGDAWPSTTSVGGVAPESVPPATAQRRKQGQRRPGERKPAIDRVGPAPSAA